MHSNFGQAKIASQISGGAIHHSSDQIKNRNNLPQNSVISIKPAGG